MFNSLAIKWTEIAKIRREILHVSIVQQDFTHLLPSLHRPCNSIRATFNEILLGIFH